MKLGRKKSDDPEGQEDQKKMQTGIEVDKVEVCDNVAKFLVAKGLAKKQWIVIKEIPLVEIEQVEKFGNRLNVTWKGVTEAFFTKKKADSFGSLVGQVNAMHEEQQKIKENNEKEKKAALRKNELLGAIKNSIGVIDQSFNVLIGLQKKHIVWQSLEAYSNSLGANIALTGQTIPNLPLDFSKIVSAIKTQNPKETSNEAFSILKTTYEYFNGLNVDDEFKENHPNLQDAKAVILAYFMINDLLLGKVVGDKENKEEISQLDSVLQNLAAEINFKVNIDELIRSIDKINVSSTIESILERSRETFKQELKQQLNPKKELLTTTPSFPKSEVSVTSMAKSEVSMEPVTKNEAIVEPVATNEVAVEPGATREVTVKTVAKSEVNVEPMTKSEVNLEPVAESEANVESPSKSEVTMEPIAKNEVIMEPVAKSKVAVEPAAKREVVKVEPITKGEKSQKDIKVSKVEISDNIARFFVAEGLFKKQWVVVKEIPLVEIEQVEKFGNELTVTWKGATYKFVSKEKTDLFRKLVDQINAIHEGTEPAASPSDAPQPASESGVPPDSSPDPQP